MCVSEYVVQILTKKKSKKGRSGICMYDTYKNKKITKIRKKENDLIGQGIFSFCISLKNFLFWRVPQLMKKAERFLMLG
jgi:hypothetical protein